MGLSPGQTLVWRNKRSEPDKGTNLNKQSSEGKKNKDLMVHYDIFFF